jgi:hypothetical protein
MEPLEAGLEPSTLWLTATRSSQLTYSSARNDIKKVVINKLV